MGKLRIPIFVALLLYLTGPTPSSAFIKAAIGFRLGLSPAEKGYGQPTEVLGLHSKSPIIKGQFLTGVHGQPKSSSASAPESTHAQNSVAHSPAQPHSSPAKDPAAGNGLLRHLKILGVNLYLGGPKGQTQGSNEGQSQGERGQYSHNVQTIDKEGNSSGRSMVPELQEIFLPAASQYRPHPNSVESSGPPPSKGFSLASLMRGPGWNIAAGRPSLFRIPLRLPFMSRSHSGQGQGSNPNPKSEIPVGLGSAPSSSQHHYSTLFKSQRPQIMMQMQGSAHPNFNFRPPHQQPQMMYRVPFQNQGYPQMNPMQIQASNYPMTPFQGPNSFNQHQRPYFENHQNSRQSGNAHGHFANQGQSPPMPDDFQHPEGFEYSHTDSSPIVSMGTTSYDEPPVMMEDGQGQGHGQGQNYGHGNGQKVNEGPYNLFDYQNQNQRSSQQPSNLYPAHARPQTQLQAPRRNANAHAHGREEFGGYGAETQMGEMKVISREEFEAAVGAVTRSTRIKNSPQKKIHQAEEKPTPKQRQMARYMRRRQTTQIPTEEKATGPATQPPTRRTRSKSRSKSSEVV